ncbi:Acetyl-CoA C-acetyltransferase [Chelatococcus asaccharovorans]|nr:Acetyl-CoA C-acetyltransferase [Chelatococcus asaccharovorans]CAH1679143.1 Acetyl-CoA C-acetyltransferase [Chelatococcus asaccharovorans]
MTVPGDPHGGASGTAKGTLMTLDRVAVVSSAQTELRPAWSGAQHIDLISAVVAQVFKGTGLTLEDVDFVFDSGSDVLDGRSISNCGFLGAMGAHHKEESRVEEDGLWAAQYGVTKIASGAARVGLIIAYSKPSESETNAFYASQCEPFYQRPVGFDHRAASGLQAQRYLADAALDLSALARVTHQRWSDAARHGKVAIDKVPDEAAVLADVNAAAPLTELMLSRPLDGAVAVLLASEDIARRVARPPVWVTGMGSASDRHAFASRTPGRLEACEAAAAMALRKAGWQAAKADIAEVSASSAASELMVLEALGLAKQGQAISLLDNASTAINRSGGALPADPIMATGLVRLAEAARQLSYPAEYGLSAVTSAIVHGAGGVGMQSHCVFTLEV